MKKSVIIYHDYLNTIWEDLTNEEVGQLVKALVLFDDIGQITEFEDRAVKIAYKRMVNDCEINRDKWESRAKTSRENGKKGGRPKTQQVNEETQENPVGYSGINEKPRKPVNVNVNVNDNVNVNVKGNSGLKEKRIINQTTGELMTDEEAENHISRLMSRIKLGIV